MNGIAVARPNTTPSFIDPSNSQFPTLSTQLTQVLYGLLNAHQMHIEYIINVHTLEGFHFSVSHRGLPLQVIRRKYVAPRAHAYMVSPFRSRGLVHAIVLNQFFLF